MDYIKSESFLCVATLLEMILRDQGDIKHDRFRIANDIGITLPPTQEKLKNRIRNAKISSDVVECGIRIDPVQIEDLFKKYGVTLNVEYMRATPFLMLKDEEKSWGNAYVIFLFSYGELVDNTDLEDVGHAALYIGHSSDFQTVTIYDPGPDGYGKKDVKTMVLEEAMYQRRGGYLLIKKIGETL